MKEKKNILLIKGNGVYGAVRKYIDEFAAGLRELGYNTIILDGNVKTFKAKHQWLIEHYELYAVIDCQAMVLELLPNQKYDAHIAQVHYFCDHPLYHYSRLARLDENNIILNVDRKHTEYMKNRYPKFKNIAFVPLSGNGADRLIPYEQREIDVLFTGSYWVPKRPASKVENAGFAEDVRWNVQQLLLEKPQISVEEALERVLLNYQIEITNDEFTQILNEFEDIEFYVRSFYRDLMIRTLLRHGVELWVYGKGWDDLTCEGIENLHILEGGAEVARRALGHAKIVLNIMPGFKDGFQERIAAAMLSEAVVVTDVSIYLEEHFSDGKELVFYRLEQLEELPGKIKELLEDSRHAKQIADLGKKIALEQHTWRNRVLQIAEQIERYHGNTVFDESCAGEELEVPIELVRTSYLVEEIGVQISEELNGINDLNNQGYAEYEDAVRMLTKLKIWNGKLEQICGYHFYSRNNLDVFADYFEAALRDKNRFSELMLVLLLTVDQMVCGLKEKYEAAGIEELLMGAPAGEDHQLYKKMAAKYLQEKYKGNGENDIFLWKEDLLAEQHDIQSYPRKLINKYRDMVIDVQYDEEWDMLYVMHFGKRMYYPRTYSVSQVYAHYRFCCIEQDVESPHRYLDGSFCVESGDIVIDAGVAEGSFALQVIDQVSKIYLVECDVKWFPALERTFASYRNKVVLVQKMLGNRNDENWITIDTMVGEDKIDFIKMDVEGAEADVLLGAEETLRKNEGIRCVIATYHASGMEDRIKKFLKERGFDVSNTAGYIFYNNYEKPVWDNELRHALVRAERNDDKERLQKFLEKISRYDMALYFDGFPEIDSAFEEIGRWLNFMAEPKKQQILQQLLQTAKEAPGWVGVHILSFCMTVDKRAEIAECLLQVIVKADYDEIGEYSKLSHYWQVSRAVFADGHLRSETVEILLTELYRNIFDAFSMALGIVQRHYIPIEERNHNMVVVFSGQVLGLEHAPTKTLLDRCYVLKTVLQKEVVIVNTAMHMPKKGRAPFYGMHDGGYRPELTGQSFLEFKGEQFAFWQCPDNMPDLNVMSDLIQFIKKKKPYYICSIGASELCADICGMLVPEITISTVFSEIATSCGEYQILGKQKLTAADRKRLQILGVEENKLKRAMFTFSFKKQSHRFTRQMLELPEGKFLLIVVGWRLDEEVSEEFLQMLSQVIEKEPAVGVVFMGKFTKYRERLAGYAKLQDHTYNVGQQEDALAVLDCVDLYVNPRRQGGGSSVTEALYKGLPAVTLPTGDVSVAAGEEFWVEDFAEMSSQIVQYYKNPAFYQRMSNKAKKRAELLMDSRENFGTVVREIEKELNDKCV